MLRVFTTKRYSLTWRFENAAKQCKDIPTLKQLNNKLQPNYKKSPTFPSREQYLIDISRGYTEQSIKDYAAVIQLGSEMFETVSEVVGFIEKHPLPEAINSKILNRHSNREGNKAYTIALRNYLDNVGIPYKSAFVMSIKTTRRAIKNPDGLDRKGKLRLTYDVVDGHILITNIGYHRYRDSLYSDTDNSGVELVTL